LAARDLLANVFLEHSPMAARHKHAFFGGAAAFGFSLCILGAGNDAAFVKEAIQDNLAEVQVGAHADSEDDEVASYIADSLPKLQDYLTMVQALQGRVHADSSSPH
jgi:hypothetical protein